MIVLPLKQEETETGKQDRILSVERALESRRSGIDSFRESKVNDSASSFELNSLPDLLVVESMVIICQPNSCCYEMMSSDSSSMDIFIENGIFVFLWNYRGYGRSTGSPTMQVNFFPFYFSLSIFKRRIL